MSFLSKSQLIRLIAADTGLSQKKSFNIVNVLLGIITTSLSKGEIVSIRGFGKFYVKDQQKRKRRNPSTGQFITVGPKKRVQFKCSKFIYEEIYPNITLSIEWRALISGLLQVGLRIHYVYCLDSIDAC